MPAGAPSPGGVLAGAQAYGGAQSFIWYLLGYSAMQSSYSAAQSSPPVTYDQVVQTANEYLTNSAMTNGADTFGVPSSGPQADYFANGATAVGVPSGGPGSAYYQNGATVAGLEPVVVGQDGGTTPLADAAAELAAAREAGVQETAPADAGVAVPAEAGAAPAPEDAGQAPGVAEGGIPPTIPAYVVDAGAPAIANVSEGQGPGPTPGGGGGTTWFSGVTPPETGKPSVWVSTPSMMPAASQRFARASDGAQWIPAIVGGSALLAALVLLALGTRKGATG